MTYTAIDTFYPAAEWLRDSPSRRDGVDEPAEASLRAYGCQLVQEAGILLRLPQVVLNTGQVLLHRFYCKQSLARFSVKRVAATCVWLSSKLEESPRGLETIIRVFHRIELRRHGNPIRHLGDSYLEELVRDLSRLERRVLKELGYVCHVEHPHKFIPSYLNVLEAPELMQAAWNLANDSLRTTLCVRFKSEVVACGVIYAAARRSRVPLPEDPPWWMLFDADEAGIQEVCRVLAHLYSLPRLQYMPVLERRVLKELGHVCHVEHPHKFIPSYLNVLAAPELMQAAWNLANDSLRTTLCVKFKSEVVACGVIYAVARRSGVPLPEDPPWWTLFDADEEGIQEVCRVLAHLAHATVHASS